MTISQRLKYVLLQRRIWKHLLEHPLFTLRIGWKRVAMFPTRRFVGTTLTSPITGEKIFNIQSLVNYWSMHVVRELGDEWQLALREKLSPVIFDVGANIGQFGKLVLSLNPSAEVIAIEPWPGMKVFNSHAKKFYDFAIGSKNEHKFLHTAGEGWTATTSDLYGEENPVVLSQIRTLDEIWRLSGYPEIDLLKIDVDGAEAEVLAGAGAVLNRTKTILIEVSSKEPWKILPKNFYWKNVAGADWYGERV